jgi:hypothetical protein
MLPLETAFTSFRSFPGVDADSRVTSTGAEVPPIRPRTATHLLLRSASNPIALRWPALLVSVIGRDAAGFRPAGWLSYGGWWRIGYLLRQRHNHLCPSPRNAIPSNLGGNSAMGRSDRFVPLRQWHLIPRLYVRVVSFHGKKKESCDWSMSGYTKSPNTISKQLRVASPPRNLALGR